MCKSQPTCSLPPNRHKVKQEARFKEICLDQSTEGFHFYEAVLNKDQHLNQSMQCSVSNLEWKKWLWERDKFRKRQLKSNMMRHHEPISTCVPCCAVAVLENNCQNFLFVLINEMGSFSVYLWSREPCNRQEQWLLNLIYMTGEEIQHLIYITCGKSSLPPLPVSGGNNCHSLVI